MPNSYYNHGSFPSTGSAATSASMRAELQLVSTGFDKLPTLAGNQNQLVVVNNTGTALIATAVLPPLDAVDSTFLIRDNSDATRKFRFEASTVTAGQTRVLTVPDANTTIVGTDTTQTLTNKTLTLPVIAQITNTGTLTLPTSTDTLVGRATTDTLTNKTLTAPVIATIVNVGTLTLPTSTDTLVGRATTDTLTNKSISGSSNTLTNIANGSLVNSAVTIGSTSLSLGGTMTSLAGVTISGSSNTITNIANASLTNSSVTIGSTNVALGATAATIAGLTLTGAAVNGTVGATTPSTGAFTTISTSGAATLASGTVNGAALVNISDSQTLTNKSISGSANTITNIANASLVNSGLTIGTTNIALGGTSTTLAGLTAVTSTSFTGALTGNASTATTLQTARTINGVSFDGSANITITAVNPNALTIGTGLSGSSYNGSSAVTIAIDSTVATLTGSQTLTNKTISGSNNTLSNIANASLTNSSLTIGSTNIALGATSTTLAGLTSVTSTSFTGALTGNASTATTLQNSRTLWGQSFNGSANVTGSLTSVGDITGTGAVTLTATGGTLALAATGANIITFATNGTTQGRVDSSGNLLIGTTTNTNSSKIVSAGTISETVGSTQYLVASQYDVGTAPNQIPLNQYLGNLAFQNSNGLVLNGDAFIRDGFGLAWFDSTNANYWAQYNSSGNFIFSNGTERARMDTNGHLLLGNTTITNTRLGVRGATTDNTQNALLCKNSGDFDLLQVRNDGQITTGTRTLSPYNNTTASAANMFVTSDGVLQRSTSSQKYKTEIQDATHGLAEVMALRSVTYKGKTDGDRIFGGFVAEEVHAAGLTEFVEYAEDGTPDALAYGHMVALMAKAIQELKAEVDALKAQINQGA